MTIKQMILFIISIILVIFSLTITYLNCNPLYSLFITFINGICCGVWIALIYNNIRLNQFEKLIHSENEKFKLFMEDLQQQNQINYDINNNNIIDLDKNVDKDLNK